ncbi:MAG TPA: TonB-dependent receptor [Gemmatimonadales bacterium]|nr:TonB-dependent receptor [Gemmatimonadales bacterium]
MISSLLFTAALLGGPSPLPPGAGTLSGLVTDSAGAPLASARVALVELNRATLTDPAGRYTFSEVPSGTWSVSFSLIGYRPVVRRVTVGAAAVSLDATLHQSLIELPALQVTASPIATTSLTSPQPLGLLTEGDLQLAPAQNLGQTLEHLPGLRNLSTGNGIGKPVIRGLTSNRVLVLENGSRVESQQWGDEHGPNVEASDAERVEVIRGPQSVLYGSDALGGVVNVITRPVPEALDRPGFVDARVALGYSTNGTAPEGSLALEGASGGVGYRLGATGRASDDVRTPGGHLANSGAGNYTLRGAAGWHAAWGTLQGEVAWRDEKVEIHEDPAEETGATPFQRIGDFRSRGTLNLALGSSRLDLIGGWQENRRREFEAAGDAAVALGLASRTGTLEAHLHHAPLGPLVGTVGLSLAHTDVGTFGEEFLVPESRDLAFGVFAFEQGELGRLTITAGARFDARSLEVDAEPALGNPDDSRDWTAATGSLGLLYRVAEPVAVVLNLGRGYRAPSAFELYANGVHEGTVRFERGNAALEEETSLNTDLALRVQTGAVNAEAGVFHNRIANYIFADPTGLVDPGSGLQVHDYVQGDARLVGVEASMDAHPRDWLHLRASADHVRGDNLDTDQPLPFIAPFRAQLTARAELGSRGSLQDWYFWAGGEANARQERLDPDDVAPPGYGLLHAGIGFRLALGDAPIAVDVIGRNLLDHSYRSFLSRYKLYAEDPGRNVTVRMRTEFGL